VEIIYHFVKLIQSDSSSRVAAIRKNESHWQFIETCMIVTLKDKIRIFNLMMLLMENWPLLSRVRFQKLGFLEEFGDRPIPIITWKGKKTTWMSIRDWWLQWVARSWRDIAPNIQLSCPNFTFSTIFDDPRDRRGINSIFSMKQLKSWSCVFLLFI